MRVPEHIVVERRRRLAKLLASRRYLPLRDICAELGISEATARRDLAALESQRVVTRTYGGAVSEFDDRFPSFSERDNLGRDGKAEIARKAAAVVQTGETLYFDAGTTVAAIAREVAASVKGALRVLTCSLPVAEILARLPEASVHLTGGRFLPQQSALFGEHAVASLEGWSFDHAFVGAEGIDSDGVWNSGPGIVALQRAAHARSKCFYVCVDSTKAGRKAPTRLFSWQESFVLVSDLQEEQLSEFGCVRSLPSGTRAGHS